MEASTSSLGVVGIHTLHAFDEYSATISWIRVAATCTVAMAPAFITMMLIELMPLAPLESGWATNWGLWIRLFVTSFFVSLGISMQFHTFAPVANLSMKSIVFIAVGAAAGFLMELVPLANYWVFPIPFTLATSTPIWLLALASCSAAAIGWRRLRDNKLLRDQLALVISVITVQSYMSIIYPAYNAGFIALSGITQLASVLALPAIKYFMKWLMKRVAGHTEAGIILVMASADLYEALYLFKCMQSAGSIQSGIALIIVDLVQNIIHLQGLHHQVRILESSVSDGRTCLTVEISSAALSNRHQYFLQLYGTW